MIGDDEISLYIILGILALTPFLLVNYYKEPFKRNKLFKPKNLKEWIIEQLKRRK